VKPLSSSNIADFFEAYKLVQRIVFILSAERITKAQLDGIARIERRLEAACRARDIKAVRELNSQFHASIAAGCGNTYLDQTYVKLTEDSDRLSSLLLRFTVDTDWKAHTAHLQDDHNQILAALAKRDHRAIAQRSDEHVAFFKERVYRALEKSTPPAAEFDPR
jgi:DNA-binding GntR family transcriptional regulator